MRAEPVVILPVALILLTVGSQMNLFYPLFVVAFATLLLGVVVTGQRSPR